MFGAIVFISIMFIVTGGSLLAVFLYNRQFDKVLKQYPELRELFKKCNDLVEESTTFYNTQVLPLEWSIDDITKKYKYYPEEQFDFIYDQLESVKKEYYQTITQYNIIDAEYKKVKKEIQEFYKQHPKVEKIMKNFL